MTLVVEMGERHCQGFAFIIFFQDMQTTSNSERTTLIHDVDDDSDEPGS